MILLQFLHLGILLLFCTPSFQSDASNLPTYTGAVVEYHPVTNGINPRLVAEVNANNYRKIIQTAAAYNVDIIAFPEYGITSLPKEGDREKVFNATGLRAFFRQVASYVPDPNESLLLCDTNNKYAKSLKIISCAARESKMYVVVNHHEIEDCPTANCSSDGLLIYNTNVVFDREGRVISRYRKSTLYKETGTNVTAQPEMAVFSTDFGVTYGHFICADLFNEKPASSFIKHPNITDIIFTTHWFDELPFLTALQYEAAWSYVADVNFLAAGYSDGLTGSGGIGIFAGKSGPIQLHYSPTTTNALLVAEIPKLNRRNRVENVRAGKSVVHIFSPAELPSSSNDFNSDPRNISWTQAREDLDDYTTVLLNSTEALHVSTLCNRDLCCEFHLESSYDENLAAQPGSKQYRYRLAVFSGVTKIDEEEKGTEVCALIGCAGESLDDCGKLYPVMSNVVTPLSFDSLIISRRANLANGAVYLPSTLTPDLEPMGNGQFTYFVSGRNESSLLLLALTRPTRELLTFGIHGRRYDRDRPAKSSAAASVSWLLTLFLAMPIIYWLLASVK